MNSTECEDMPLRRFPLLSSLSFILLYLFPADEIGCRSARTQSLVERLTVVQDQGSNCVIRDPDG
jgi:hypothetical protein